MFAVRMSKNTTETFYEETLRTSFLVCYTVEELEPVLLIITAGDFKRFQSPK